MRKIRSSKSLSSRYFSLVIKLVLGFFVGLIYLPPSFGSPIVSQPIECVNTFRSTHLLIYYWLEKNWHRLSPPPADGTQFAAKFLSTLDSKTIEIVPDNVELKYQGQRVSALFNEQTGKIRLRCDRFMSEVTQGTHQIFVAHEVFRKMESRSSSVFEGDSYKYTSQFPPRLSLAEERDPRGVRILATMVGVYKALSDMREESGEFWILEKNDRFRPSKAVPEAFNLTFCFHAHRPNLFRPETWDENIATSKNCILEFDLRFSEFNDIYTMMDLSDVIYQGTPISNLVHYKQMESSTASLSECDHHWVFPEFEICLSLTNATGITKVKTFTVRGTRPDEIAKGHNRPYYLHYEMGGIAYFGEIKKVHQAGRIFETFENMKIQMVSLKALEKFSTGESHINLTYQAQGESSQSKEKTMRAVFTPKYTVGNDQGSPGTRLPTYEPLQFNLDISEGINSVAVYELSGVFIGDSAISNLRSLSVNQFEGSRDCTSLWQADSLEICLKVDHGIIRKLEVIKLGKDRTHLTDSRYWIKYAVGKTPFFGGERGPK
ncbi:MAG: hypothetical protein JNM39_11425 [Bdellovibrionaceae bacterium]|nr:hypothetical protein [Pseudobdellovibrionaceae bacterium]